MKKLLMLGFFAGMHVGTTICQADTPESEKKSTTHEALENFKRESEWATVQLPKDVLRALKNIVDDKNYDIVCGYAKEIRSTKKAASLRLAVLINFDVIFAAHNRSLLNRIVSLDNLYMALILRWCMNGGYRNLGASKYVLYVGAYAVVRDLLDEGYCYYYFDEYVSRFETILSLLAE